MFFFKHFYIFIPFDLNMFVVFLLSWIVIWSFLVQCACRPAGKGLLQLLPVSPRSWHRCPEWSRNTYNSIVFYYNKLKLEPIVIHSISLQYSSYFCIKWLCSKIWNLRTLYCLLYACSHNTGVHYWPVLYKVQYFTINWMNDNKKQYLGRRKLLRSMTVVSKSWPLSTRSVSVS